MEKRRRAFLIGMAGAAGGLLLSGCKEGGGPVPGGGTRYSVYLSTDDGPMRCSRAIDRVIRQSGVPLAAFVVGRHARSERFRSYLEAYRDNPHITLANHSYTHANGRYAEYYRHPEGVWEDFEKNRNFLGLFGRKGRLPGRNSWRIGGRTYDADRSARAAADLLASRGYTLYGWDLEWTHTHTGAPIGDAETLYRKIRSRLLRGQTFTPGHLMLLMHDQMFGGAGARRELADLITLLQADPEIRLRPLSAYPLRVAGGAGSPARGPRLIRGSTTGVGESTPVDPLKFAR